MKKESALNKAQSMNESVKRGKVRVKNHEMVIGYLRDLDHLYLDCELYDELFQEADRVAVYNREFPFAVCHPEN